MSLQLSQHGGRCCGMRHIFNFPTAFPGQEPTVKVYKDIIGSAMRHSTGCGLIEVSLIDRQLNTNLIAALKSKGFYLVSRFSNPNTQNYVNVFHKLKGKRKNMLEGSPFYAK